MNENENMKKHTAQNMKTVQAFVTSKLHEQISSGMMHLKYPLLLIEKSNLCSGGSGFPLSYLNGHLRYVRRHISILKCASASLNKTFPSFLPTSVSWLTYHRLWYVIPGCGKYPKDGFLYITNVACFLHDIELKITQYLTSSIQLLTMFQLRR